MSKPYFLPDKYSMSVKIDKLEKQLAKANERVAELEKRLKDANEGKGSYTWTKEQYESFKRYEQLHKEQSDD